MVLLTAPELQIKLRIQIDPDDVIRFFKENHRLQPVRFGYDVGYAEVLEYGCGPLNRFQPTYNNGQYSYETIYEEIDRWARLKLAIKNKNERKAFVDRLVDRMFNKGLYPHPFYRPALIWLEENMQAKFDEGLSLFQIADEALRIANKNIMDQNLPFTGQLQKSAIIKELSWGEAGDPKDETEWVDENEKYKLEREAGWSKNRSRS